MNFSRILTIFIFAWLLTGCLGYVKAMKRYDAGYSEIQLGNGIYRVRYSGPGMNPPDTLKHHLLRRASELCPKGYTLSTITIADETIMHRLEPEYRYAEAEIECTNS
jgi:hypothetical protein